ncbi:hypothetical protein [Streptomyces pini]|uniref:Uncharacterized protein n=1 Tax=Streptomyces pini TaxID=1520580 RepID=A0A1I4BYW9_9ACTN|nr:hypothetical protein [Streptomyces pini]SFK73855.1 hypothetical protein SAMN05192584_108189 [Streptomyces pini]
MNHLAAIPTELTTNTLTTAGLAIGLGLLITEHVRWFRGSGGTAAAGGGAPGGKAKDPKELVPMWFGIAVGTLMVACPAGLLGTAAGFLRWGGNGIGGLIMDWTTGAQATAVAQASAPAIDGYGAIVLTALVIALFLLRKTFAKAIKGRFWRGVWCGTLLAIGTGVFALIGNTVVPGVNELGAWAIGSLVNSSPL